MRNRVRKIVAFAAWSVLLGSTGSPAATVKPVLHGKHWMAITGKPLAATAGAMTFQKGGNAVDAACAMLAATSTMFDTLSWGGETQALIFHPRTGKVIAINALVLLRRSPRRGSAGGKKEGKPFLAFAVQGGDGQDQNLLQFFLNVVEFGMNVQEAAEAPNIGSYQMRSSFGAHESRPGRLELNESVPPWVREELAGMGYKIETRRKTSGPINAIFFDREHGTMWGGSSDFGEDYGIAW